MDAKELVTLLKLWRSKWHTEEVTDSEIRMLLTSMSCDRPIKKLFDSDLETITYDLEESLCIYFAMHDHGFSYRDAISLFEVADLHEVYDLVLEAPEDLTILEWFLLILEHAMEFTDDILKSS